MQIRLILSLVVVSSMLAQTPKTPAAPASAQIADLVLADRILANEGVLDAYGHVSVRDDRNPNHYLLSRGMPASMVTASDIIEYDLDSMPLHDTRAGFTERFIHGEIYKARPDVMAIIHAHTPDIIPFTVTSIPLRPMIHMAGFIPQNVPIFEIRKTAGMSDMLVRDNALGHALAESLGDKTIVLMRGHGAAIVGPTLHVAVGRAIYLAMNAKEQLQAIMIGGGQVTYLEPEEAQKAFNQDGFERGWTYWKSRVAH